MSSGGSIKLTVLLQEQFWVGVFEREDYRGYSVARTIFGGEPTDVEVFYFLLNQYDSIRFSTPLLDNTEPVIREYKNPKRRMREVKHMQSKQPMISKAQDALRIEIEKNKLTSKKKSSEENRLEEQRRFEMKQAKKKKKLRGH